LTGLQVESFADASYYLPAFGNFIAIYDLDGTCEPSVNYRGEGRNAMNGFGATASARSFSDEMLRYLWEQNAPTGKFRYYDGLLYIMCLFLNCSLTLLVIANRSEVQEHDVKALFIL
jgi:hypothetical protein